MPRLICGYSLQSGIRLEEKHSFHNELKDEWDVYGADNFVICLGDINRHIVRHVDGIDGAH